jgi:hypothetical protein
METAKDRLLVAVPFFRNAIATAQKKLSEGGRVQLGILATNADGSGNVEMRFDCEEFFADIEELVNAPAQTTEDDVRVAAEKFLQEHGLKSPQ